MDFPEVRSGDPITQQVWDQARKAVMAQRLKSGPGIHLKAMADGIVISAPVKTPKWDHPFKVRISGLTARVGIGYINASILPEIEEVSLGGTNDEPDPVLEFEEPKLDEQGRGYIALEATWDDEWQLLKEHAVSVIQCARLDSLDDTSPPDSARIIGGGGVPLLPGRRARWALAMLRRREGGRLDIFQVTHGDLQVQAQPDSPSSETGRAIWL